MDDGVSLAPGDTMVPVQISPCVGGLVRTWANDGETHLWSAGDDSWLLGRQGMGLYARTVQEERRYRECGLLSKDAGALIVQSRFPEEPVDGSSVQVPGHVLDVTPVEHDQGEGAMKQAFADFEFLLTRVVKNTASSGEFLVVEPGGWGSPLEPFVLFALIDKGEGPVSIVETAPAPHGSRMWEPHILAGRPSTSLSAPATAETVEVAPLLMLEAISRWGLTPWDVALTFGHFEQDALG